MQIKSGKEEIIYLLTKAIEKYRSDTGQQIIQNTNRKNYEALAIVLSDISNRLPEKSEDWGTDKYAPAMHDGAREYPHRKYDITGGQIKDALSGIVSNPRPFLVDACYIYLYGMGRRAFKQNPADPRLLEITAEDKKEENSSAEKEAHAMKQQFETLQNRLRQAGRRIKIVSLLSGLGLLAAAVFSVRYQLGKKQWKTLKADMNILPYQPSQAEIDSLEGVWLCYTGSPQARITYPDRFHKVVFNLVEVTYKNGYFMYNRYGASFNHTGYMQFESPGIVSVYSRIRNNSGKTESPRHSLLNLFEATAYKPAISASWNFDVGDKNKIIGIREIYIKLGKGGTIEEVINEIENASCQCKVIRWRRANKPLETFYLKNQSLDSLPDKELRPLIDENSILLGKPQEGLVLSADSTR